MSGYGMHMMILYELIMIVQILRRENGRSLHELKNTQLLQVQYMYEKILRYFFEYIMLSYFVLGDFFFSVSNIYRLITHKFLHDDPDLVNTLRPIFFVRAVNYVSF